MPYNPSNYTRCEKCKHIDRENEKCKITNDGWLVSDRAGTCHQFEGVESMKVRCIDDSHFEKILKINGIYNVVSENKEHYELFIGGSPGFFKKSRFEIVEDKRKDEKLEENPHEKLIKEFEENVKKGAEMLAKCSMSNTDLKNNNVDHPSYYNEGKFEVIDVIDDWNLGFNLGNTIKYIARCEHKENRKQDLEKAMWYLKRELERVKANDNA